MKILITGIAGFAGYSIADQLTKENNNLYIVLNTNNTIYVVNETRYS